MRIAGHRGTRLHAPENSLQALVSAYTAGADVLEFDLQMTKDGHLVLSHDGDIARLTGERGLIRDMWLKELRHTSGQFDFSATFNPQGVADFKYYRTSRRLQIEIYEQLLDRLPRDVELLIELKHDSAQDDAMRAVFVNKALGALDKRGRLDSVVMYSKDPAVIRELRAKSAEVRLAAFDWELSPAEQLALIDDLEAEKRKLKETIAKQQALDMEESLHNLKGQLKKGEACPLCGSEEHPQPFKGRRKKGGQVAESEESLEAIERRLDLARTELSQSRERIARLEGRLEEREDDEQEEVPELDEATMAGLKNTLQVVESRVSKKEDLLKRLREMRSEIKPGRVRLKKMRLLKERLEATIEGVESQYESRKKSVLLTMREFFGQFREATFEELVALVDSEKERLEERLQEIEEYRFSTDRAELMAETFALQLAETRASEIRRDELQQKADDLRAQLEDSFKMDFANWDDLTFSLSRVARESSRGDVSVLDRDTLIRTVERQLHQSQELLATMPVPEMRAEQIRQVLAREREQLELKVGRRAALEKSIEQSQEDVRLYDEVVEEIRELESRQKCLERMATLAIGKKGPTFHDWYLEKLFRRVIEAANLRLEVLAPNRFCLGLQPGLEVKIVDFMAGKERSATTLSGGESFLASLALALALGDILQGDRESREKLKTLFIDEGFGYLDKRALDAALDCLESLKQEGRTVGIISHVPALRERIRAQVVLASNDSPLPYGVDRVQVFAE